PGTPPGTTAARSPSIEPRTGAASRIGSGPARVPARLSPTHCPGRLSRTPRHAVPHPECRPRGGGRLAVGLVGCDRPPRDQADPADAPAAPRFEDVTDAVGLNFTHDCGPTGTYFMPQSMYGGAAVFDADGDGRLDILLLQGAGPNTGVGNRLYLQTPDGKFRDASAGSRLDFDGYNVGVAIGDV